MRQRINRLLKDLEDVPVLAVSGLGCLAASAWVAWGLAAGLAVVGASLLFMDLEGHG